MSGNRGYAAAYKHLESIAQTFDHHQHSSQQQQQQQQQPQQRFNSPNFPNYNPGASHGTNSTYTATGTSNPHHRNNNGETTSTFPVQHQQQHHSLLMSFGAVYQQQQQQQHALSFNGYDFSYDPTSPANGAAGNNNRRLSPIPLPGGLMGPAASSLPSQQQQNKAHHRRHHQHLQHPTNSNHHNSSNNNASSNMRRVTSLEEFLLLNPGILSPSSLDPLPVVTGSNSLSGPVSPHLLSSSSCVASLAVDQSWLDDLSVEVPGLSLEPLTGKQIVSKIKQSLDHVTQRYIPCVDFLVQCQQELRRGLTASQQQHHSTRSSRNRATAGRSLTARQYYATFVQNLPHRFQIKNQYFMEKQALQEAVTGIHQLVSDAHTAERLGAEAVKNQFLGGMKDGQSWGLRKWMATHGNALTICTTVECIRQAVQQLDRSLDTTRKLAALLRPLASDALKRLQNDVPKTYQAHSSAHPYLPFFHRLEGALRSLSQFDPDDDDVIVLDDSDDDEPEPVMSRAPPPSRKRKASSLSPPRPPSRKRPPPSAVPPPTASPPKPPPPKAVQTPITLEIDDDDEDDDDEEEESDETKNSEDDVNGARCNTDPLSESNTRHGASNNEGEGVDSNDEDAKDNYNDSINDDDSSVMEVFQLINDTESNNTSADDRVSNSINMVNKKQNPQEASESWKCPSCFQQAYSSTDTCEHCEEVNFLRDLTFYDTVGALLESTANSSKHSSTGSLTPPLPQQQRPQHLQLHYDTDADFGSAISSLFAAHESTKHSATELSPPIPTWPLPLANPSGVYAVSLSMADNVDRVAALFDEDQQHFIRPPNAPFGKFWDGERYAAALKLFSSFLRRTDASHFVEPVDDDQLIRMGKPPFSHVIRHPLCFRDIVASLIQDVEGGGDTIPLGVDGRLPARGLNNWNMWKGMDLLQAIDLVFLNNLAYGKIFEETSDSKAFRTKTNRLRKDFWDEINRIVVGQVGNSDVERRRLCTPTRRAESSGFVVYKIQHL